MSKHTLPLLLQIRNTRFNDPESTAPIWQHIQKEPQHKPTLYAHFADLITQQGIVFHDTFLLALREDDKVDNFVRPLEQYLRTSITQPNSNSSRLLPAFTAVVTHFPELKHLVVEWLYTNKQLPDRKNILTPAVIDVILTERPTFGLWAATLHRPDIVQTLNEQEWITLQQWLQEQDQHNTENISAHYLSSFDKVMYFDMNHLITLASYDSRIMIWLESHIMRLVQDDYFDIDEFLHDIQYLPTSVLSSFIDHFRSLLPLGQYLQKPEVTSETAYETFNNSLSYLVHHADLSTEDYCHALLLSSEFDDQQMMDLVAIKYPHIRELVDKTLWEQGTTNFPLSQWMAQDIVLIACGSTRNYCQLSQEYEAQITALEGPDARYNINYQHMVQYMLHQARLHSTSETNLYLA